MHEAPLIFVPTLIELCLLSLQEKSSHIYKQRKLNDNDRVSLVENKRAQKERTHSNNSGLSYDAQLSIENNSQCLSSNTDAKLFANFSSTRDICIRMLRNHELLLNRKGETNRTNNCQDEMQRLKCKSCDAIGYSTMMLICDNCEGPFHLKCSGVFSRKVLPDEWYCHPCSRKKRKALQNMSLGNGKVMKRSAKHGRENSSKSTSSIRIGEDFQAEVQEWFGPIHDDDGYYQEIKEVRPVELGNLNERHGHEPMTQ